MADGKNIEIKITATGGDQAAAEVRKVETATGNLSGTTGGKGLKSLAEETTKVTSANVKMGTGFQNVGYQVQDLAVQIGSGTSAFRALGQQLPQLLSGFGPVGITLGTVAAVALPLAGALLNMGDAAKTAGEQADEAADKLEKLGNVRAKKATEESAQDYRQFIAALDDETIAYKRQNDEIQRTIDLLQAKRRAQAEIDSADAALALAKIDASDAPEEEKIKQRAKVQDDLERKRFENRKAESGDRVNAAYNKAAGATGDATIARSAEDAVKQRLAEQEAEAAALKGRVGAADQAAARLPGLDKKITGLSVPTPYVEGEEFLRGEQEAKRLADLDKAKAERDQAANASGGASAEDRRRLVELKGEDGISGLNKDLAKGIEGLTKAAEGKEETARTAQGDYQGVREVETAKLGGDFEATKRRLETGRITSDTAAERAAATAKQKADQEREREANKAATGTRKDAGEAGRNARAAERLVPSDAPDQARAAFEKISDGLQNGDQGGEVKQLLTLMEQLASFVEKKGDKELARRIEILEQRIRGKK